jgi:HEPN domain-containing protein
LPRPEPRDLADLFLRKASSDLAAVRTLADDVDQDDAVVGFHAQQAVEKALKAVLARALGDDPPRVHDINLLLRLLQNQGVDVPPHLTAGRVLSPWAVTMRYDDLEEVLDRPAAIQVAADAIEWARRVLLPPASG